VIDRRSLAGGGVSAKKNIRKEKRILLYAAPSKRQKTPMDRRKSIHRARALPLKSEGRPALKKL
jgi:hypothetical protein